MNIIGTLRENKAEIAKLWESGLTSAEIAAQYGVPPKAVLNLASQNRSEFAYRGTNEPHIVSRILEGFKTIDIATTEYDLSRMALTKGVMEIGSCECR